MFRLLVGALFMLPMASGAQPQQQQIKALAETIIKRSAQEPDPAVLKRVRDLLKQASSELARSRRAQANRKNPCTDFARDIYQRTMTQKTAKAQALKRCRLPVDMLGVRYLFETYSKVQEARPAFERALDHARARDLRGRMDFLKFVVGIFDDTRTQQAALRDGLIFMDAVPPTAEACVREGHAELIKTAVSLVALERARSTCLGADRR
ncbi:MAG: hypothetical protein ACI9U2_001626 [Bradymonadia bacterium]|jgi:hypothetical protein